MIKVLSTNITSPLGLTSQQNYDAVKSGNSALKSYEMWRGVPDRFGASFFSDGQVAELKLDGYTIFESVVIRSMEDAISRSGVDVTSPRTVFILSTTKGNVDELASDQSRDGEYLSPGATAKKIALHFNIPTEPIVVCNACISGVTAQLLADRLISSGHYDNAVVCGADSQSLFTVGGFISFKSLSPEPCRPFDIERLGLNIGEAAATIVFGKCAPSDDGWKIVAGALNNDAYHLSAPSPQGTGSLGVIRATLEGFDASGLATVNAHGTATMFNDQMESKAIAGAGLSEVPLSALKGFYGHTMGASGVLECILTMLSIDDGLILPVKGFEEIGVSGKISVSNLAQETDKRSFLKMISGFGGCNGALLYTRDDTPNAVEELKPTPKATHSVRITESSLEIDGQKVAVESKGKELLLELYKNYVGDYPKFYKMDPFSKVVFLASEILLRQEGDSSDREGRGVILFNHSSSIVADRRHIATIADEEGFFPSPSTFLYTLPNIVTGEIAIKNGFKGETSLYILDGRSDSLIDKITDSTFANSSIPSMITGWADCSDEDVFEADLKILIK
ncbi:MAG: 3-oxoacyl-ACP synthase [Bacteroidales bacterium]|nr:3-oxoacyl-ACP synthase [Bacteroidales bacterium]